MNLDKWKENKNKWPARKQWLSFLNLISRTERFTLVFLLLLGTVAGIVWWRISYLASTKEIPAEGGTLKEIIVGQPQSLNPLFSPLNEADRDVSELIFAGLLKYNSDGKVVKDLAKDFKRSKDGLNYEFTLKDNIFWSDGREITTQDVLFTMQSIRDPEVQSPLRIIWQDIKIELKDNKTIKFTLPNAYPPFLENFTVKILPYHVFQEVSPQDLILHPPENLTSSGPFEVKVIEEDEEKNIKKIVLRRNPNFYGKKTFLEEV
ncbi:MAG: ABC transporter substrate-binding protein, partial [Candidatus Bathyarchaeota archaeon]|nr:ABC transporter substrate-binding protein [Candidatus Bathyarchaeota archaeon]